MWNDTKPNEFYPEDTIMFYGETLKTLERLRIIRDLRLGKYDVVVGVNLLREGIDIPEVSLIAILDADKEGFLRSTRSLNIRKKWNTKKIYR